MTNTTGFPCRFPTFTAVSLVFDRCTYSRFPLLIPCSIIEARNCSPVPFLTCNQASSYRMSHHRTPPALVQIYHREIRHQTGSCRNEPSSHPTPRRCQWLPFPDVQAMLSLSSLVVLPRQNGSGRLLLHHIRLCHNTWHSDYAQGWRVVEI